VSGPIPTLYTQVETAVVDRLRLGLGSMVRSVASYGGELDDDMGAIVAALPAAWVTFGGITNSRPTSTSRRKFRCEGKFVVMVGDRNGRGEQASRQGGVQASEVGTYPLLYAVRRLLASQDLGLPIEAFTPGRVRTLFNTKVARQALSVFAAEFDTVWIESALDLDRWPAPVAGDEEDPDQVFATYKGKLDTPYPDLDRVALHVYPAPPNQEDPAVTDVVPLNTEESS